MKYSDGVGYDKNRECIRGGKIKAPQVSYRERESIESVDCQVNHIDSHSKKTRDGDGEKIVAQRRVECVLGIYSDYNIGHQRI